MNSRHEPQTQVCLFVYVCLSVFICVTTHVISEHAQNLSIFVA